jgi:hypothetical protein
LLHDYRERRSGFRVFDDFDGAFSPSDAAMAKRLESIPDPLRSVAKRLYGLARDGFFLFRVCEWKIDYLAEALLHAISANNPLSLAGNTRSLVEHLAALTFISDALATSTKQLSGRSDPAQIDQVIGKAELVLQRAYYGTSPKAAKKAEAALHVESECLAALVKRAADIKDVYAFLCEYVHPNHGSNLLVSSGLLGHGRLNPPPEFHQETIDRICRYCSQSLLLLRQAGVELESPLLILSDLIDRCCVPGASPANVFSVRPARPEGDGRSKETAFHFRRARTAFEAREMAYRFFAEAGIEIVGTLAAVGAIEEGYIYDTFPTNKGLIWVKSPFKL